ncbi:MAG: GntR family transcriptional regulator [Eubacteriales bacterium]|nr:GntR family transcriptional regulator [Eubacteriales bacterium]
MININFRDARPIYEQVRDGFRDLIISGALKVGEKLPSVRELATTLTINPNTIQRAYRELENDGYIVSVSGKGSFVSRPTAAIEARRAELISQLSALINELKTVGVTEDELTDLIKGGKA